jgi:hypothetical protein
MLSVIYAKCRKQAHYAECRYAECHYAECRYAKCHHSECRYAECRYAECQYAECYYAECHYAECRYAECRGAPYTLSNYCTGLITAVKSFMIRAAENLKWRRKRLGFIKKAAHNNFPRTSYPPSRARRTHAFNMMVLEGEKKNEKTSHFLFLINALNGKVGGEREREREV